MVEVNERFTHRRTIRKPIPRNGKTIRYPDPWNDTKNSFPALYRFANVQNLNFNVPENLSLKSWMVLVTLQNNLYE